MLTKWSGGVLAVVLVTGSCMVSYPAADPFAGPPPGSERPGTPMYQVAFGGKCGICSVSLDVAGLRDVYVDTTLIVRRHRIPATPGGVVVMSVAPVGDWGPVERIEIRVNGEVIAEANNGDLEGLPGTEGGGALSVRAVLPQD